MKGFWRVTIAVRRSQTGRGYAGTWLASGSHSAAAIKKVLAALDLGGDEVVETYGEPWAAGDVACVGPMLRSPEHDQLPGEEAS